GADDNCDSGGQHRTSMCGSPVDCPMRGPRARSCPPIQSSPRGHRPPVRSIRSPQTTGQHQLDPQSLGNHIDRMSRAAWALCGSCEDAEDLVQEAYALVLRKPRILNTDNDLSYLLR